MLGLIIKKELEENIKSQRFIIITLLIFIVVSFSNYEMYNQYTKNIKNENYKTQDDKFFIKKSPSALSIYIKGTQELQERIFIFGEGLYEPKELSVGFNLNIFRQLFPTLDFLYICKVILSLLALIMSFDLISGEYTNGTLKLIMSNSLSKKILLHGKTIANFILLIAPLIVIFIINLTIISLAGKVDIVSKDYLRIFIILILSLIYLGSFFNLGILFSSISKSSQNSMIGCFIIWALIIFIIPNISSLIAKNNYTLPNEKILEEKKQWIINKKENNQNIKNDELHTKLNQYTADYRKKLQKYIHLNKNLNRISPAGSFTLITTNIAGYGLKDELKLRNLLTKYINSNRDNNYFKNKHIHKFNKYMTPLTASIKNSVVDFIILILFCLITVCGSYIAFSKYNIE